MRPDPPARPDRSALPAGFVLLTAIVLVVVATVGHPAPSAAQSVVRTLEVEQRLLNEQLDQELDAYRQARSRADKARARVADLSQELDGALAGTASDDRIADLDRELRLAREQQKVAGDEVSGLVDRILDHRQRLALVRSELERRRGAAASLPDPITGTWRLSLEGGGPERAPARTGLLDLELDGTEVHGTLGLADGSFGSVSGTFVRGALDLQRVSAGSGLDLILEGDYDPEKGDLSGTWRTAVSGRGEPGGGTWRAVRTEREESK